MLNGSSSEFLPRHLFYQRNYRLPVRGIFIWMPAETSPIWPSTGRNPALNYLVESPSHLHPFPWDKIKEIDAESSLIIVVTIIDVSGLFFDVVKDKYVFFMYVLPAKLISKDLES